MKKVMFIVPLLLMSAGVFSQIVKNKELGHSAAGDTVKSTIFPTYSRIYTNNPLLRLECSQITVSNNLYVTRDVLSDALKCNRIGTAAGNPTMNTGIENINIGYQCGISNLTGRNNTTIGVQAMVQNRYGSYNTNLGSFTGFFQDTSQYNVLLGYATGYNVLGSYNTMIGGLAGFGNTKQRNIFLGFSAGYGNNGSDSLVIDNEENRVSPFVCGNLALNRLTVNTSLVTDSAIRTMADAVTNKTINKVWDTWAALDTSSLIVDYTLGGKPTLDLIDQLGRTTMQVTATRRFNYGLHWSNYNYTGPAPYCIFADSTANLHIWFTGASGSGVGNAGNIFGGTDDGAAMSSGDRLFTYQFMGASDNAHTVRNGADIYAVTQAAWGATWPTEMIFRTSQTTAVAERMRITFNGLVHIGNTPTVTPTLSLSFNGQADRTAGVERHATAAGKNFSITAGGGASAGTNLDGGKLYFSAGVTTGSGMSSIRLQRYSRTAAATTDNTASDALIIPSSKSCADNSSTTLFNIACAAGASAGCIVHYTIKTSGGAGNESHTETGTVSVMVSNDGAVTTSINKEWSRQHKSDAGTYTVTFAASAANPSVISVTADTNLNVASIISYIITNADNQTITQL